MRIISGIVFSTLALCILTLSCSNTDYVRGTDVLTGLRAYNNKTHETGFINLPDAPLRIIEFQSGETETKYGRHEWRQAVRVKNISGKGIRRYDIGFYLYNDFKEVLKNGSYSDTDFTKNGEVENHKLTLTIFKSFGQGAVAVAFISKVAFEDGSVWQTDLDDVDIMGAAEQLFRKLNTRN